MVVGVLGQAGHRALSHVDMVVKVVQDHVTNQHLCTVVVSVLVSHETLNRVTKTSVQVLVSGIRFVDSYYVAYTLHYTSSIVCL